MLLAAYTAGILLTTALQLKSVEVFGLLASLLLLLWVLLHRSSWGWLPLGAALLLAGYLHTVQTLEPPAHVTQIIRFADNQPLIIEATVISIDKRSEGGFRLLTEAHLVLRDKKAISSSGKILLYIEAGELSPRPGQIVRWRSRVRQPTRFGTPGEFDYPLYLAARGIYLTAFIASAEELTVMANHPARRTAWFENWRLAIAERITAVVPQEASGPTQSLLVGMRSGISKSQRTLLSQGGVSHLFAISGLHFGLLAMLLYLTGKWFYTRSERLVLWCPPQLILPILLILPLAFYLLLTGNAWATRRAFLMATVVAFLFSSGRRTPPLSLLATVAFGLLLANPLALFQPGFQLSFAGLAGILIWLPRWEKNLTGLSPLLRWPLTMILTTTAATLATAPITLWTFHQFAPAGLLTNLVAIPLIAWGAVPLGLAAIAAAPLSLTLADCGLQLSARLIMLALDCVERMILWPGLQAMQIYMARSQLLLLSGIICCLILPGRQAKRRLCQATILIAAAAFAWLIHPQSNELKITAISVGQGDATLVSLPDGSHYLIDGGGLPDTGIDPGERLVAPTLGRLGINHLDGVILTHNHPDHSDGLIHILRHFAVDHVWIACNSKQLPPDFNKVMARKGITPLQLEQGWTNVVQQEGCRLSLYAPSQKAKDLNERSIALFVGNDQQGALLTGDLGKSGLQQLVRDGVPGRVSLLKLSHHGSRLSQPEYYLSVMQPDVVFVSAGRNNSYGFPHQATLDACAAQKVPIYRTDLEGTLPFNIRDGRWQIDSQNSL